MIYHKIGISIQKIEVVYLYLFYKIGSNMFITNKNQQAK